MAIARKAAQLPPQARPEHESHYSQCIANFLGPTGLRMVVSDLLHPPFVGERIELDLMRSGRVLDGGRYIYYDDTEQKNRLRVLAEEQLDHQISEESQDSWSSDASSNGCDSPRTWDVQSVRAEVVKIDFDPWQHTRTWVLRGVGGTALKNEKHVPFQRSEDFQMDTDFELRDLDNPVMSGISYKYACDRPCPWCQGSAHPCEVKLEMPKSDHEYDQRTYVVQRWHNARWDRFPCASSASSSASSSALDEERQGWLEWQQWQEWSQQGWQEWSSQGWQGWQQWSSHGWQEWQYTNSEGNHQLPYY